MQQRLQDNWKPLAAGAAVAIAVARLYSKRLAPPPSPPHLDWSRAVFGHRGCRNHPSIPENTIPAFAYCLEQGATGFECDVRLSSTGELVVHHDDTTEPILSDPKGKRAVHDLTLEELKQLRYRDDPKKTVQIATARDAMVWAMNKNNTTNSGCKVLLEIKITYGVSNGSQAAVTELLKLYRDEELSTFMHGNVIVISFDPRILYLIRSQLSDVHVMQLSRNDAATSAAKGSGGSAPWMFRFAPTVCDAVLRAMYRVAPWFIYGGKHACVGPMWSMMTPAEMKRSVGNGTPVYLWGFEHAEEYTDEVRSIAGVFIAADDDFEKYS